jgi:Fe2+ or Zn2+ uptake regulation protein
LFSRVGLRCTRQREVLYETLVQTRSHPTADELFHLAAARAGVDSGELSLATVYNTLDALVAAGLCRRIPCPSGAARFDGEMGDHIHVLTADDRLLDVPDDLSRRVLGSLTPAVLTEIERRLGVGVVNLSIQVGVGGAAPRDPADGDRTEATTSI